MLPDPITTARIRAVVQPHALQQLLRHIIVMSTTKNPSPTQLDHMHHDRANPKSGGNEKRGIEKTVLQCNALELNGSKQHPHSP